jgi:hypothetical protein
MHTTQECSVLASLLGIGRLLKTDFQPVDNSLVRLVCERSQSDVSQGETLLKVSGGITFELELRRRSRRGSIEQPEHSQPVTTFAKRLLSRVRDGRLQGRQILRHPERSLRPLQSSERDDHIECGLRVPPIDESCESFGDDLVSGTGVEPMLGQDRIVQIGQCADCLRLYPREDIVSSQFEQLIAGLRTEDVSQNPHAMQPSALVEIRLSQQLDDSGWIVAKLSLDRELCLQPLVVAVGIQ